MRLIYKKKLYLTLALVIGFALLFSGFVLPDRVAEAKESNAKKDAPMMLAAAKKNTKKKKSSKRRTTRKKKTTKIVDPTDPTSVLYLDTSGKLAGIGDPNVPASAAVRAGRGWHPAALEATGLPKDRYGLIDWAAIVRKNMIKPRFSLDPKASEMPPMDLDIIVKAKGDYVNDVRYPHWIHTYWLKCEVCHATKGGAIFIPARGSNNMTMVGIVQGKWCGRCHGKVAFPLTDCKRCHTVPKKKKK
jgi:c(7)-type cytochrome triheme protein